MKLDIIKQDSERKGIKAGVKLGKKDAIKKNTIRLRQMGADDATIFKMLKEDYHDEFSDEEIRGLMKENK